MIPMQDSAAYVQKVTVLITVVLKYRHLTKEEVQQLAQSVKISPAMKQREQSMQEQEDTEQELQVEEQESDNEEDENQSMQEPEVAEQELQVEENTEEQETMKTTQVKQKVKKSKVQRFVDTVRKIPFIYDIARFSAFTVATLALLLTGSDPQMQRPALV